MNITYRFRDCAKIFRKLTFFNELFYTPEQKLDEGTITAAGYSGKVHFCYPAGYRNTGSVHGNFSVLLAKFVKRGRFERKVFWGTRFGCIRSGKALRGNAYFSSLIAFDEGERFLFVYRTRSSNRSVCHVIWLCLNQHCGKTSTHVPG